MIRWFDNRYFSTVLSVVLFLAIVLALRRIYIPESEPLTRRLEVIQEIKKYIRRSEPVPDEIPPKPIVQPRKRIVPENIRESLEKLRENQRMAKIPEKETAKIQDIPKFEMKPPVPERRFETPASRLEMGISGDRDLLKNNRISADESDNVIRVARGSTGGVEERDEGIRGLVGEGAGGPVVGGGEEEEVPVVSILPGGVSGGSRERLSDIMNPLIDWMKRNPAEFSAVEQKFTEFVPRDFTSRDLFMVEGKTYEILLLFRESNSELRIALIEGNEAILLIDTGLQERINYLRTGEVIRSVDFDRIISIKSTQKPASEQETMHFYRIFQSWWNWVHNVKS